jgi:xanthine dehydrogenase accessory factor
MASGRTKRVESGDIEVYVEPYAPAPSIVVCGAGHIAVPLAVMAKQAGFHVTVIDDRADYANRRRFPTADEVVADSFADALSQISIASTTAIVLVTRGHRQDWDCLRVVIDSRAGYIGMIGSRRRVKAAMMGLEAEGFSAERLARVAAPIGLDIGAETPEEIAVAILAEIVLTRRGGTGRPLSAAR